MALLAALILLALSAALATAIFSAAQASRRASRTTRARVRVEVGVRRAFAEVLQGWTAALDTLPLGMAARVALDSEPAMDGPPLLRTAQVERVTADFYAITVDLRAFSIDHPMAHRRARLWVERTARDSAGGPPIAPLVVTPWGFADLY